MGPVVCLVVAEDSEELFDFLIDTFCFSVGLRVKGGGKGLVNVELGPASGKVSGLFLSLFGLFKDKKGKKGKKGQRHSVLLKPSRFTIQVAFYFERQ